MNIRPLTHGLATGLVLATALAHHGLAMTTELRVRHHPFVTLEHVNLNIGDAARAREFFVEGLGFAEDPRAEAVHERTVRAGNTEQQGLLWLNIGLQQLHMPIEPPAQRVRGWMSLTFRSLDALASRLNSSGVEFERKDAPHDHILLTDPIGSNRILAVDDFLPESFLGPAPTIETTIDRALPGGLALGLGMHEVGFYVPVGTAAKIHRFYQHYFSSSAPDLRREGRECAIHIGYHQTLVFQETDEEIDPYDGHHVAIYVNDFLSSYRLFKAAGLVWENPRFPQFTYGSESDVLLHHEFRFKDITDLDTGEVLFVLEHEIRALSHPSFSCSSYLKPEDDPHEL